MATERNKEQLTFEAGKVFSPGRPINEHELFAGRKDQVRQVVDAINHLGQHAIIFGERGVGKTSLANVLTGILHSHGEIVFPIRVNCDSVDTYSTLWSKVFDDVQIVRETPRTGYIDRKTEQTDFVADELSDEITPLEVLKTLQILSNDKAVIVIVDEFDRMSNRNISALFADTIKALSDHFVRSTLVIVGVADSIDELVAEHRSIERSLVQVKMPRMSLEELNQIINNGLDRLDMEINDDALSHISLLSQGLPHYTHHLGLYAAREALDRDTMVITIDHVTTAINKALELSQESIRSDYYKATTSPRMDTLFKQVLLACALARTDEIGFFTAASVREPMCLIMGKDYGIPSFSRHLNQFSARTRGNILNKVGEKHRFRFRFSNPLMQPYVIMCGLADGLLNDQLLEELRSRKEVS